MRWEFYQILNLMYTLWKASPTNSQGPGSHPALVLDKWRKREGFNGATDVATMSKKARPTASRWRVGQTWKRRGTEKAKHGLLRLLIVWTCLFSGACVCLHRLSMCEPFLCYAPLPRCWGLNPVHIYMMPKTLLVSNFLEHSIEI